MTHTPERRIPRATACRPVRHLANLLAASRRGAGMATALLLTLAAPIAGQDLEVGTWTGTMVPPEGIPAPVAFEVVDDGGRQAITMTVEGTAPRPLETIALNGDLLTFSFTMGTDVRCELERRSDGSFAGPCSSGPMRMGTLTMEPPAG